MKRHDIGTAKDLATYRIGIAKHDLNAAKTLLDANELRGANNRAYYAIYHIISAIHALDGKAYRRHKDALASFNKEYIRTEVFPRAYGRRISEAEEIRHASDYDDFYIATKEEAIEQIKLAEELIGVIEKYCFERIKKS